jgi:hypothetical protein
MIERRTYSIEEVAAILGLSRNSAYVAAREDRLPVPVIKIGKRMMVSCAALHRILGDSTPNDELLRRRQLRVAARDLIALHTRCPDLFEHVLPISTEDMQTLVELAEFEIGREDLENGPDPGSCDQTPPKRG